jgi:Tol biopolymer transport system component
MALIGSDGKVQLYLRPLDSPTAQPLAGTEGATFPFWSPDSRFLGFFADRRLKRLDPLGGAVQTICEAPEGRGAAWGPDGIIVFAPRVDGGLSRVEAGGGSPTPLETNPGSGISHRLPRFLPDGRHLLFFSTGPKDRGVSVFDLRARKAQFLFRSDSEAHYVEPGYVAFIRERNLMVQRFEPHSLRTVGEAMPIAEGVSRSPERATAGFSFAGTRLLTFQAARGEESQFTWLDLDGKKLGTVGEPGVVAGFGGSGPFEVSPDGKRIVASLLGAEGDRDLWMLDAASGVRTRFTFGPGSKTAPVWSPDGRQVAYSLDLRRLLLKDASGVAGEQELFFNGDSNRATSWYPDGKTLAFMIQSSQTSSFDIWLLSVEDRKARPFLASSANEMDGRFSPDGKWFAYRSDESGRMELYVVPYPGPGGKWQISSGTPARGWNRCAWLSSGDLAYAASEDKWYAVTLSPRGQALEINAPRPILGGASTAGMGVHYAPGMKRFLIAAPVHGERPAEVSLVADWSARIPER